MAELLGEAEVEGEVVVLVALRDRGKCGILARVEGSNGCKAEPVMPFFV